jgi:hypothetical protein
MSESLCISHDCPLKKKCLKAAENNPNVKFGTFVVCFDQTYFNKTGKCRSFTDDHVKNGE